MLCAVEVGGEGLGESKTEDLGGPMAGDNGVVSIGKPRVIGRIGVVGAGLVPCGISGQEKTSMGESFVGGVGESRKGGLVEACGVSDIGRAFEVGGGIANEERSEEGAEEAKTISDRIQSLPSAPTV